MGPAAYRRSDTVAYLLSQSTVALLTVPLFTGVIGYVTNWTGVLMLFYPVHFRGYRADWIHSLARLLPYKLQQIPGIMVGGIGWQGIVLGLDSDLADELSRWVLAEPGRFDPDDLRSWRIGSRAWLSVADDSVTRSGASSGRSGCSSCRP